MAFNGFPKDTTKFLTELSKNNSREWFNANKDRYENSVQTPAKEFLHTIAPKLSDIAGHPLAGKLFRIYRDVRFSKDKTPFNMHIRMLFHSIETESSCGNKPVFCFSLEPKKIITGAGTGSMEFSKNTLQRFRDSVANESTGKALVKLLRRYDNIDGFRVDPPILKRVPQGFDKHHPREALLRHKALMIWHEEALPSELCTPKITTTLTRRYRKMIPIYDWINAL